MKGRHKRVSNSKVGSVRACNGDLSAEALVADPVEKGVRDVLDACAVLDHDTTRVRGTVRSACVDKPGLPREHIHATLRGWVKRIDRDADSMIRSLVSLCDALGG